MFTPKFTISKEGVRWFGGFLLLGLVLIPFTLTGAGIALVLGILACLFFRIPLRYPPQDVGLVLSPADGKIVCIDEVNEPLFVKNQCKRISIFLSIFDVHMNYAPVTGIIDWIAYQKGRFHWAFEPKASEANENQRIGISTSLGKILLRQIAGTVARRIVLFKNVTQSVQGGERIGMIKFGSRVEIYIPENFPLKVRLGDRVAGGLTVLAQAS